MMENGIGSVFTATAAILGVFGLIQNIATTILICVLIYIGILVIEILKRKYLK